MQLLILLILYTIRREFDVYIYLQYYIHTYMYIHLLSTPYTLRLTPYCRNICISGPIDNNLIEIDISTSSSQAPDTKEWLGKANFNVQNILSDFVLRSLATAPASRRREEREEGEDSCSSASTTDSESDNVEEVGGEMDDAPSRASLQSLNPSSVLIDHQHAASSFERSRYV